MGVSLGFPIPRGVGVPMGGSLGTSIGGRFGTDSCAYLPLTPLSLYIIYSKVRA